MKQIQVPGIVYSLLLAVAAWATDYFTTGDGSGIPWAAILVAAIPVLIKSFSVVNTTPAEPEEPASSSRSIPSYEEYTARTEQKTTMQRWLFG